ncbi:hypothetical protein C0993_010716, partial [Termitomyces sp. T159_Od127]
MTPKLPPQPSSSSAAPGVLAQSSYPGASSSSNLTEQPPHSGAFVPVQSGFTGIPDDVDIHNISPDLKKEGSDWFAIFNPGVKRVLDVSLVHNLMHE